MARLTFINSLITSTLIMLVIAKLYLIKLSVIIDGLDMLFIDQIRIKIESINLLYSDLPNASLV